MLASALASVGCAAETQAASSVEGEKGYWSQVGSSFHLHQGEWAYAEGYFLEGEQIWAECDLACSNIDLYLYDFDGGPLFADDVVAYESLVDPSGYADRLAAQDDLPDSVPVVTAPRDGWYGIEVPMRRCAETRGCAVTVSSDWGF